MLLHAQKNKVLSVLVVVVVTPDEVWLSSWSYERAYHLLCVGESRGCSLVVGERPVLTTLGSLDWTTYFASRIATTRLLALATLR